MRHLLGFAVVLGTSSVAFAGDHGVGVQGGVPENIGQNQWLLYMATGIFVLAVLHTFLVGKFQKIAHGFEEGSMKENVFHLLGEVEVVFLLWAAFLLNVITLVIGWDSAIGYVDSLDFTEPAFVFVIMVMAATRPVIDAADFLIRGFSRLLFFLPKNVSFFFAALTVGPLLGSFVTEPAAMTVTALVLRRQYFERNMSTSMMYAVLGTLFVNISIGGVLTSFAAPPVLMVASTWGWDIDPAFMARTFGYKALVAVIINTLVLCVVFRKQLRNLTPQTDSDEHGNGEAKMAAPWWVTVVHLGFITFTVVTSHHSKVFLGGFLFFLAFAYVAKEFQETLKLRESLLVGGFLAGLVTLGGLQRWWLEPLLGSLNTFSLFSGAIGLTAVTDNAALTYLGSLVPNLAESMKYVLVAGAVAGGGLTVIANAPNPAGYSILNDCFKDEAKGVMGISPFGLLLAAIVPTIIAACSFWFFPSL